MKRQAILLGALGLAALALLGTLLFLLSRPEPAGEAEEPRPEAAVLTTGGADAVERVDVKNAAGGFRLERAGDGFALAGLEGLPADSSKARALAASAGGLEAVQEIAEPGPLADYGLEQPAVRVEAALRDGTEVRFSLGDDAPASLGRYLLMDGKVYLCEKEPLEAFEYGPEDFLSLQVTAPLAAGEIADRVALAAAGRAPIELTYMPGEPAAPETSSGGEGGGVPAYYRMTAPVAADVRLTDVSGWLDPAFGLTADAVAAVRPDGDRLKELGLDEPEVRLTAVTTEGRTVDLSLSRSFGEVRYLMSGGVPLVYEVAAGAPGWTGVSPESLARSILPGVSPEEIASLTVAGQDRAYRFTSNPDGSVTADGRTATRERFETMVRDLWDLSPQPLDGEADPRFPPALTMEFSYRDGRTSDRVELAPTGDGRLYVTVNGVCAFTAGEWQVQTLLDRCEKALEPEVAASGG